MKRKQLITGMHFQFRPNSSLNKGIETQLPMEDPEYQKGIVWFDNIFPYKYPLVDPRKYFIDSYSKSFMENEKFQELLPAFPEGCDLKIVRAEENLKEGGLYLEFKYKGGTAQEAVEHIQKHVASKNTKQWFKIGSVSAFEVKGVPWVEDLISRVPSNRLKVRPIYLTYQILGLLLTF